MKYFEHFSCKEFFPHCTANEIFESINEGYFDNVLRCFDILNAFRFETDYAIVVTSSFRNIFHNSKVGGSPISQHMLGQALDFKPLVDFYFDSMVFDFQKFLKESVFKALVGQVIIHNNYIHFALRTQGHSKLVIYDKRTSKKFD